MINKFIQYNEDFAEECLYVSVNPQDKTFDYSGISGIYYFHSLYNNVGVYIRDGKVTDLKQFFLVYTGGYWYISNDEEKYCFLWGNHGGYFRLASKGQILNFLFFNMDLQLQ